MQEDIINGFKAEIEIVNKGRIKFNGFSFPLIPTLEYLADGPDKTNPDRLFITDSKQRFQFYFETGFEKLPENLNENEYQKLRIIHAGKDLLIWYPLSNTGTRQKKLGYFRIEFPDMKNSPACCGQLNILQDGDYFEKLRELPELYGLLSDVRIC